MFLGDLWGPLVLCLVLSLFVSLMFNYRTLALSHQDGSMVFQIVFIVIWLGSIIVTLNGQLLGGSMYSFVLPG